MTTVNTKSGRIIKVVSREEEKRAYVEYANGERKYVEQKAMLVQVLVPRT